jgi:hypothetical protein
MPSLPTSPPADPNGPDTDNIQQGDQTGPDSVQGGATR